MTRDATPSSKPGNGASTHEGARPEREGFGRVDLALLGTALIWGINFTAVKAALAHIPPLPFNVIRLTGASLLLLALSTARKPRRTASAGGGARRPLTRADLAQLVVLGLLGHTAYQLFFIFGVNETTASSSALMLGTTPVAVAILSAVLRLERPSLGSWAGIVLSLLGVYLVIGYASELSGSWVGDLLVLCATVCWSSYTVASKPLLARHGPIRVTAYSMLVGTIFFVPLGLSQTVALPVREIPWQAWSATVFSLVCGLSVAYLLWYYGVSRVGATRTAAYANLTPIAALVVSWIALGERLSPTQIFGAALILAGVYGVRRSRVASGKGPPIVARAEHAAHAVDPLTAGR